MTSMTQETSNSLCFDFFPKPDFRTASEAKPLGPRTSSITPFSSSLEFTLSLDDTRWETRPPAGRLMIAVYCTQWSNGCKKEADWVAVLQLLCGLKLHVLPSVAGNQAATSLSCAVTIWEGFSCSTRWALECVHTTELDSVPIPTVQQQRSTPTLQHDQSWPTIDICIVIVNDLESKRSEIPRAIWGS